MTGRTSYRLWLAPLMAPRCPSSYLAAATSFISCLPLITAAPTLASKYSTKVSWRKMHFVCLSWLEIMLSLQVLGGGKWPIFRHNVLLEIILIVSKHYAKNNTPNCLTGIVRTTIVNVCRKINTFGRLFWTNQLNWILFVLFSFFLKKYTYSGVTVDSYSCLDPGIPVNGIRYGQDFSIGSTVSFGCDSGYRLSHEEPLVCEKNHWWSHPLPTCDGKSFQSTLFQAHTVETRYLQLTVRLNSTKLV